MKPNTWKITLEKESGSYSVEENNMSGGIEDIMEELVRPVLLAAGFGEQRVDEYIYGGEDSETVELKIRDIMLEHQKYREELRSGLNDTLSWCRNQENKGTERIVIYEGLRARLDRIMVDFFNY